MNCAFTEKDGVYTCLRQGCGVTLRVGKSGLDIKNTCSSPNGELLDTPTAWDKVKNFGKALVTHTVAGFEKTTEAEAEQRKNICEACPFNVGWVCQRKGCGCKLLEKINWKSEKCPENKWPGDTP